MRRYVAEAFDPLAADETEVVVTKPVTLTLRAGVWIVGPREIVERAANGTNLTFGVGAPSPGVSTVYLVNFVFVPRK